MPDFPQLIGSEKQVRWARSIRAQKSEEWSRNLGDNPLHHEMLSRLLVNESAAWWISYRDCDLKNVLGAYTIGNQGLTTANTPTNTTPNSPLNTTAVTNACVVAPDDDEFGGVMEVSV